MKTADDFRKSIGGADASFYRFVDQTLCSLECEEVRPVKKKISMGFALAAGLVLLAVTALAAGSWGIVGFIRKQGGEAMEEKLVTQVKQNAYLPVFNADKDHLPSRLVTGESTLVDISLDEVLRDGDWLYVAMTLKPKQYRTLVTAGIKSDVGLGGWTEEYGKSNGCERMVNVEIDMPVEHADHELMEDGTLKLIAQVKYPQAEALFEQREEAAFLPLRLTQYKLKGEEQWTTQINERVYVAVFNLKDK